MERKETVPTRENEAAGAALSDKEQGTRPRPGAAKEITLFGHQEEAFAELMTTATVAFSGGWKDWPVWPRLNQLLVGPSGSGKTALVRKVAQTLNLPLFECSTATWILTGTSGRGALQTWPSLLEFLLENRLGVIFLDEVDKLTGTSEWSSYLRTELYGLLDRTLPQDLIRASNLGFESASDRSKTATEHGLAQIRLRHGMLLLAAGAFEPYWSGREARPIGFRATAERSSTIERPTLDQIQRLLPVELANRFRAKVVFLKPLRLSDYLQMLRQTSRHLPAELADSFLELGLETALAAWEAGLGPRWIEELVTETLARQVTAPVPSAANKLHAT